MVDPHKDPEMHLILERLEIRPTIYVARPAGQVAVATLYHLGLVTYVWGEGRDEGVMIVRKAPDGRPPRRPQGMTS